MDGKPNRWKVENSWGEESGVEGFWMMSDAWMDEYTYQIVVRKEFLTKEQLDAFNSEPIVLAPWDPMGSLVGLIYIKQNQFPWTSYISGKCKGTVGACSLQVPKLQTRG